MPEAPLYTPDGQQTGTTTLPAVFAVRYHPDAIFRYLRYLAAHQRSSIAQTKTRGEVRGGGKKPWRQKGTGRARQGSSRSPQWVGGGVVFGPTAERNWAIRLNKKVRQLALMSALSKKVHDAELGVLDGFTLRTAKTKELDTMLKHFSAAKKLLILDEVSEELELSSRNLGSTHVIAARNLDLHKLLTADLVLITKAGTDKIQALWGSKLSKKQQAEETTTEPAPAAEAA